MTYGMFSMLCIAVSCESGSFKILLTVVSISVWLIQLTCVIVK